MEVETFADVYIFRLDGMSARCRPGPRMSGVLACRTDVGPFKVFLKDVVVCSKPDVGRLSADVGRMMHDRSHFQLFSKGRAPHTIVSRHGFCLGCGDAQCVCCDSTGLRGK